MFKRSSEILVDKERKIFRRKDKFLGEKVNKNKMTRPMHFLYSYRPDTAHLIDLCKSLYNQLIEYAVNQ